MTDEIQSGRGAWWEQHEWLVVAALCLVFVLLRLPGVSLPLHQDEYKWPLITNPTYVSVTAIPHPPLGEFIYRTAGRMVGFDVHFRFVPLLFGTLNLILLYYLVRERFGKREALVAIGIWIFSYFSVLASLMVDTDGEIMPFFFLLALIGYYKYTSGKKYTWLVLCVLACIGGFFIKLSFLLAVAAIVADFLWTQKDRLNYKKVVTYVGSGVGVLVLLALLLVLAHNVFPFFNLSTSLSYWEHFANLHHDWLQTGIQCVKALLYTSPLLVFVPLLGSKEIFSKIRPLYFFLIFSFFFYIILFDFSLGALDRYLQLVILPLSVMSAATIVSVFNLKLHSSVHPEVNRTKEFFLLGIIAALILILVQFLPHYAPPLQPKAEWISRVLSLRWNFVYPFSGGSGPLGFYVSFLFIALAWIISLIAVGCALWKPTFRKPLLMFLLIVGFSYNIVFIEEYLCGYVNGHAATLLLHAVEFIKQDPDIEHVTVYNDNGGSEIQALGKYRKRLYIDPKFDQTEKVATLNMYKEHYFVLNIPNIDSGNIYQTYFDSCQVVYRETDKQISATIYDCRQAPDIHVKPL